jgi:hypothetical protein
MAAIGDVYMLLAIGSCDLRAACFGSAAVTKDV